MSYRLQSLSDHRQTTRVHLHIPTCNANRGRRRASERAPPTSIRFLQTAIQRVHNCSDPSLQRTLCESQSKRPEATHRNEGAWKIGDGSETVDSQLEREEGDLVLVADIEATAIVELHRIVSSRLLAASVCCLVVAPLRITGRASRPSRAL